MPTIYLSPSTQEFNTYVTGNSEEYYANLIADAMVPYLRASNIDFIRNDPGGTVSDSIANSNANAIDFTWRFTPMLHRQIWREYSGDLMFTITGTAAGAGQPQKLSPTT